MSKIVLDDDLKAKLNGLNKTMEVEDGSGRLVGQFVPQEEYLKLIYAWAKAEVSDEELNRVRKETGGRTLSEIWSRLGRK
jgi:hypothetical protein